MSENESPKEPLMDLKLVEYGARDDIVAFSRRIRTMLPGGDKMTQEQTMALAQYAIALDANPFRGEIYGFVSKGRFVLQDGYKLLVRWAKRQCPYSERFEPLTDAELPEGAIGYSCYILRDDARPFLRDLIQAGAQWREAFEVAATSAIGIVTQADRTTRDGRPMSPPVGWTWQQVARKRALKNALNLSHGAPSPREIAHESWMIGDQETSVEDWLDCTPEMSQEERERQAKLSASYRQRQAEEDDRSPEDVLSENHAILHSEQTAMEI